jgi:hypothetical protein
MIFTIIVIIIIVIILSSTTVFSLSTNKAGLVQKTLNLLPNTLETKADSKLETECILRYKDDFFSTYKDEIIQQYKTDILRLYYADFLAKHKDTILEQNKQVIIDTYKDEFIDKYANEFISKNLKQFITKYNSQIRDEIFRLDYTLEEKRDLINQHKNWFYSVYFPIFVDSYKDDIIVRLEPIFMQKYFNNITKANIDEIVESNYIPFITANEEKVINDNKQDILNKYLSVFIVATTSDPTRKAIAETEVCKDPLSLVRNYIADDQSLAAPLKDKCTVIMPQLRVLSILYLESVGSSIQNFILENSYDLGDMSNIRNISFSIYCSWTSTSSTYSNVPGTKYSGLNIYTNLSDRPIKCIMEGVYRKIKSYTNGAYVYYKQYRYNTTFDEDSEYPYFYGKPKTNILKISIPNFRFPKQIRLNVSKKYYIC